MSDMPQPIFQHLSSAHQNTQNLQRMADSQEQYAKEIATIRAELERTRQEFADYKAEQNKQHEADSLNAISEKKKLYRHEYRVAAFTVALTLFIEHFLDIVDLVQFLIEQLLALAS